MAADDVCRHCVLCGFCSLHCVGFAACIVWVLQLALCEFCSLHCVGFEACIVWICSLLLSKMTSSAIHWLIQQTATVLLNGLAASQGLQSHPFSPQWLIYLTPACYARLAEDQLLLCTFVHPPPPATRVPKCNFTTYLSSLLAITNGLWLTSCCCATECTQVPIFLTV